MKPKGIVIGGPVVRVVPTPELKEEGSEFGDNDYNPLYASSLGAEQLEEEELTRALKA